MSDPKKSLKGIKVGDTVVIPRWDMRSKVSNGEEHVITRVGRTLVYIEAYHREVGFYIEDGAERCDYQPRRMYLPEEWEKEQRHIKVMTRLRNGYGVGTTGYTSDHISPEAWSEILEVLDRHAKKESDA